MPNNKSNFWETIANIGGAMEMFSAGYRGIPSQTMQQRQFRQRMNLAGMEIDRSMAIRGFGIMSPEESQEYINAKQRLGYMTGEGSALIPKDATVKDGTIYDKQGKVIGEYMEGFKPKKGIVKHEGGIVQIGERYYKYNPNLARKMEGTERGISDIQDFSRQLSEKFQGLQGQFYPSTVRTEGGQTYRYYPSYEEIMPTIQSTPEESQNAFMQWLQQQGGVLPQAPIDESGIVRARESVAKAGDPHYQRTKKAVSNAMNKNVSRAEILEGLTDEGYNLKDFPELLSYDESIPMGRRGLLNYMIQGMGLDPTTFMGLMRGYSGKIDEYKRKLLRK